MSDDPLAEIAQMFNPEPRPVLIGQPLSGEVVTGAKRPPWWRPFARRRWDRTIHAVMVMDAMAANRGMSREG